MPSRMARLSLALHELADRYAHEAALGLDPLAEVLRFSDPADQELAAWVAATLAYGRVSPMMRAIRAALVPLGEAPAHAVRATKEPRLRRELSQALEGWVWRFHTSQDLVAWILAWKDLDASGSLASHFQPRPGETADGALSRVVQGLRTALPATYGLRFSLPDPLEGGACKRWRLFLRWMVRTEWPDLGLWPGYPASELVIPLDTHVARISRYVGLSSRATPDGVMAREVTEALRRLDPADPLRFDFALSHLGILGDCPGLRQVPHCRPCPLFALCRAGKS